MDRTLFLYVLSFFARSIRSQSDHERLAIRPFTVADKALQGYVLGTLYLSDWMSCIVACQEEPMCVSYNYDRSSTFSDQHSCQLNSAGLEDLCDFDKEKHFTFTIGSVFQQLRSSAKRLLKCGENTHGDQDREYKSAIVQCEVTFRKAGCYNDNQMNRALNDSLFTREDVDGKWDWRNYLYWQQNITCRCARAAKMKNYTVFGIQHERECWSGNLTSDNGYAKYGNSSNCFSVTPRNCKDSCNLSDDDPWPCAGIAHTNFIYRFASETSSSPKQSANG